jgi:hypothetical protein
MANARWLAVLAWSFLACGGDPPAMDAAPADTGTDTASEVAEAGPDVKVDAADTAQAMDTTPVPMDVVDAMDVVDVVDVEDAVDAAEAMDTAEAMAPCPDGSLSPDGACVTATNISPRSSGCRRDCHLVLGRFGLG